MALVIAKEPCYLGAEFGGYKTPEDGSFEYNGPHHDSLEYPDGYVAPPRQGEPVRDPAVNEQNLTPTGVTAEMNPQNDGKMPGDEDKSGKGKK